MLRDALIGLPFIYQQFIMMSVSFDRIYDCLTAQDLAEPKLLPDSTEESNAGQGWAEASNNGVAAVFNNVTLSWFDEQKSRKRKKGTEKADKDESQALSINAGANDEADVNDAQPTKLKKSIMLEAVTKQAQQAPWYVVVFVRRGIQMDSFTLVSLRCGIC